MPAKKDSFTDEDYKNATEFGLTLDQIAEADADCEAMERMRTLGYNPNMVDTSWADDVLARPQPHLATAAPNDAALPEHEGQPVHQVPEPPDTPPLPEPEGQPVHQVPQPPDTPNPEPPWRKLKTDPQAPPLQEAPVEKPDHSQPWKIWNQQSPLRRKEPDDTPAKDTMWETPKSEPDAPPLEEVRVFRY